MLTEHQRNENIVLQEENNEERLIRETVSAGLPLSFLSLLSLDSLLQQKKYAGEKSHFFSRSSTMSTNFAVLTFFVLLIKSWNTIYENWKCQVRKFVKLKYCFYTESNPSKREGVQLIAKVHSHRG